MHRLFPVAGEIDPDEAYDRVGRVDGRPGVRLNMIASVDGAAYLAGRSGALGGPADRQLFVTLRSLADVILVGAGTMRTEGYRPARLDPVLQERRRAAGRPPVPPIAVVTRKCQLDWGSPFFTAADERPIVLTTARAPAGDRARAQAVADVVIAGDEGVDLARALGALGDRGHDNVLAEGGPDIAAQLALGGLLDEICLTVSPMLVGTNARRILDGPAVEPPAGLELRQVLTADGYLFLHYRRP